MATNGVEIKWSPTEKDLKPFQMPQVMYYIHFVRGDHGFKGIVGTFLINPFLQVILFHGTLM